MSGPATRLRGVAWDHPRGIAPMAATARRFNERSSDVEVAWEARSLEEFGFAGLLELSRRYDLLLIDHPHVGPGGADRTALLPLDELLPAAVLDEHAQYAVGSSHRSYQWEGHQWALAVDAAAQVSAYRPDLVSADALPRTWTDVLDFARGLPSTLRIALPLAPIDLCAAFLSLGATLGGAEFWDLERGFDRAVVDEALCLEAKLVELSHPCARSANAPRILDKLATLGDLVYVPLVFGYSNYARDGFADKLLRFSDAPGAGALPPRALLGGVGLAVSACCRDAHIAGEYVALVAGAGCQRGVYFDAGGQPADARAWDDPRLDDVAHGFFRDTRATLEGSFLAPRLAEAPHAVETRRVLGEQLRAATDDRSLRWAGAKVVEIERQLLHGTVRARSDSWSFTGRTSSR